MGTLLMKMGISSKDPKYPNLSILGNGGMANIT